MIAGLSCSLYRVALTGETNTDEGESKGGIAIGCCPIEALSVTESECVEDVFADDDNVECVIEDDKMDVEVDDDDVEIERDPLKFKDNGIVKPPSSSDGVLMTPTPELLVLLVTTLEEVDVEADA